MFVLVVGGGKVGYYLSKELVENGHEVVLMEKDKARAAHIVDELGSIVVAQDGCEGKYLRQAGSNRADIIVAVTGDDEDNLVICQMAKHHFDVPRTTTRINNPKNEDLFRHLGVDEIISPTRMALGSIEQDIPVHELLHLAALDHELEIIEAQLQSDSPAVGKSPGELQIPEGCSLNTPVSAVPVYSTYRSSSPAVSALWQTKVPPRSKRRSTSRVVRDSISVARISPSSTCSVKFFEPITIVPPPPSGVSGPPPEHECDSAAITSTSRQVPGLVMNVVARVTACVR